MSETTTVTMPATADEAESTIQLQPDTAEGLLPPPPVPSSDPRLCDAEAFDVNHTTPAPEQHALFKVSASEALGLLSANLEVLVRMTGDVPPTPPLKVATDPQMSGMQAEKESIARTNSERDLARLAAAQTARKRASSSACLTQGDDVDGVQLKKAPSPSRIHAEPEPYIVIGDDSKPLNLQHGAITRKFYSKNAPPIPVTAYLARLHHYCPMSTAVYLATSLYIHRLAVRERTIPVTKRNVHRLVLAGLRVAMKALEDLSYSHKKVAKVGGVTEVELARLEISFCFLCGFELIVREPQLERHWAQLKGDGQMGVEAVLRGMEPPALKLPTRLGKIGVGADG